VLTDVCSTLYAGKLVSELQKPQDLYTYASVRQLFDRLAHSSIMKLQKNSMDKLFDLMVMAVKKQVLLTVSPDEVNQIMLNHFDTVLHLLPDSCNARDTALRARSSVVQLYDNLSIGQWHRMRQKLCNWVQGRKIKVSLFLKDKSQKRTGDFVIDCSGRLPIGTEAPGSVVYYSESGELKSTNTVALANKENYLPAIKSFDLQEMEQRPCQLGVNMYANRTDHDLPATKPAAPPVPPPSALSAQEEKEKAERVAAAARAEISLLTNLLGPAPSEVQNTDDTFTIEDLFPENAFLQYEL
jgi:Organic solute transport protein 1